MSTTKKILTSIALFLALFLLSLPVFKYKVDLNIDAVSIPEIQELETYLKDSESKVTGLVPGTEKQILWADTTGQKTKYSIIFFHGFGASAQELYPLIPELGKELKANIYFARLKGHGVSAEEFAKTSSKDWFNDAVESFQIAQKLGEQVIIVGSSTGCLLGLWLATNPDYQNSILSLVLLSPNFHPASALSDLALYPQGMALIKLINGNERYWKPDNEGIAKYWQHHYAWEALIPMMTLVDYSTSFPYSEMNIPALFLYSEKDDVIDIGRIKSTFALYKSSQKKLLDVPQATGHVLAGIHYSPNSTSIVQQIIVKWIEDLK